jgi:hypothetical protein
VGRVGRANRDESCFGQHLLGRDVIEGGGGFECAQPVPRRRQPAQFPHGRGGHAAAGDMLRDPVAEFGGAVPLDEQVEPAKDRAVVGDKHVEGAGAGFLLCQQGAVPLGELVEELIPAVGDRGGEPGAVRAFEGQHRRGMIGSQQLQLGHRPTIPGWRAAVT